MPRVILMPATGTDGDGAVFATALAAARLFDGHLIALHVRPDVRREIASLAAADMGMTAGLDATITRMEQEAETRETTAAKAWQAFSQANGITGTDSPGTAGVSGEWQAEIGVEADWLAEYGRTVDLIVTGRQREMGIVAMDVLEAALMDTGKPVLIAPESPPAPLDGTVAIAWKDTREAGKAVSAALPFIRKAARVILFTVQESSDEESDKSALRVARTLRWHNGDVEVRALTQGESAVTTLLAAAEDAKTSLLVMGGYGHTRLREAVFGGFTRAVLERAPIPVLMAH
jgi:nucleotide-binding universal stress UspA family protein